MERINLGKVVPEKGVDYFTEEDIAAMIAEIEADIDLTDYVKNTDYASGSKGGVIKTGNYYGVTVDSGGALRGVEKTYQDYTDGHNATFISKGTLENVISGKQLETATNKTTTINSSSTDTQYPSAKAVYTIVGDIESILEELDIRRWSISEYKI